MHRQSLGSPGSKFQSGNLTASPPKPDDEIKIEKPIRSSSRTSRTVHLIPLITLLCFLILFLRSREPSPSDLPSTRGIDRISDRKVESVSSIVSAVVRNKRELMEETTQTRIRNRRLGTR